MCYNVNNEALSKFANSTNTKNPLVAPAPITATIHEQLNDRSESPMNCNAKFKEIDGKDASRREYTDNENQPRYNNKLVNNGDAQDAQRLPVRITQRGYKKNESKNKSI